MVKGVGLFVVHACFSRCREAYDHITPAGNMGMEYRLPVEYRCTAYLLALSTFHYYIRCTAYLLAISTFHSIFS